MKKENAIKIITECAQDYHTYLENQNLMFLFGASENPSFFEAAFFPRHFLHLTGVDLTNKNTSGSSDCSFSGSAERRSEEQITTCYAGEVEEL